jgi:hypothetical protein
MKKTIFMLFAAVICMSFLSVSFARDISEKKWDKKGQDCSACHMDKMMMEKKLMATQDGGLVLMMGNKLIKYDASMNMVKEVEIKMDMEAMKNMMEDMKKNCPMSGKTQEKK